MSIQVTGIIEGPLGTPSPGITIRVVSKISYRNTYRLSTEDHVTTTGGAYDFQLNEGFHKILIRYRGASSFTKLGDVSVSDQTPSPITLINLLESSSPKALVVKLQELADEASESAQSASDDADQVTLDRQQVTLLAQQVSDNADQVALDKAAAAQSEASASQSATNAAASAASAAQSEANIDVSVTESQNDIVGGSIFKGSNGDYVQNGDTVPVGTTRLRVLIGGKPTIVAMSPVSSGVISLLTETSAVIGGVLCNLPPWDFEFKNENSLAEIQQRMVSGEQLIFKAFGDSLTYGFDLTDSGAPINGSTDARALTPYPESLADALEGFYGVRPFLLNRGYPGDTSESWRTRWVSYESSDVTLIMYGTNDALNDGTGSPTVSVDEYKKNIRDLIVREKINGTSCVVLLQSPELLNSNDNNTTVQFRARNLHAYRKATDELGVEFGIPVISTSEIVGWMGDFAYSDNTHFNKYGYNEIGYNLASVFMPNGDGIKYTAGDLITPLNSQCRGYLTTQSESRYKLNGSNVAFSVLSGSRDLYIYGYFDEDCYLAIQTINSPATSSYSLSARVSGGDRSGLISNTTLISNDGSSLSKRKISALKIRKGYRVILIDTTSVSAIESIFIADKAIDDSTNSYIFRNSGLFFKPLSTSMQTITSDSTLEIGGSALIDIDLPATGGGIILQARPDFDGVPSRYVWVTRLNDTSLYIRKFTGGSPVDNVVANIFTSGINNYSIELVWIVSSDEIVILVGGVEVARITSASSVLSDGYSKIGAVSSNNTEKIVINQILSVI